LKNSQKLKEIIVIWDHKKISIQDESLPKSNRIRFFTSQERDVYEMYNYGVQLAATEYVMLVNDDMFFPPDWDQVMPLKENQIITSVLIEPGVVPVDLKNIQHNFGVNWDDFRYEEFNYYAQKYKNKHANMPYTSELGWYMPVVFPKKLFFSAGMYPTEEKFPAPNDVKFFDTLLNDKSISYAKLQSPIYHFQRLSQREGVDPKNITLVKISLRKKIRKIMRKVIK
jgi:hypothetical protein